MHAYMKLKGKEGKKKGRERRKGGREGGRVRGREGGYTMYAFTPRPTLLLKIYIGNSFYIESM